MKKPSTNRLKKLPLLLGTLLIISVAAYGTRAYFSDSASLQGDIVLELGSLSITTETATPWKYTPIAGDNTKVEANNKLEDNLDENNIVMDPKKITNVRPGDSFSREYTITNTGSLDVKLGLLTKDRKNPITELEYPYGAFTITIVKSFNDSTIMIPGSSQTIDITIAFKENIKNNENNVKANPQKIATSFLDEILTVEAIQTNANYSQQNVK